jgi:hypothetical protein
LFVKGSLAAGNLINPRLVSFGRFEQRDFPAFVL